MGISDYFYGSGDAEALGFTEESAAKDRLHKAATEAFITHRSNGLPYHEYFSTRDEGLDRIMDEHNLSPQESIEAFDLYADELRKKHGENAGAITIIIALKREGKAVLYEIQVLYGVGVRFMTDKWVAADMGVSTPETLSEDLERAIIAIMKKETGTRSAPFSALW